MLISCDRLLLAGLSGSQMTGVAGFGGDSPPSIQLLMLTAGLEARINIIVTLGKVYSRRRRQCCCVDYLWVTFRFFLPRIRSLICLSFNEFVIYRRHETSSPFHFNFFSSSENVLRRTITNHGPRPSLHHPSLR